VSAPQRTDRPTERGDSAQLWQVLERFEDAWQAGPPPCLDDFLPPDQAGRRAALAQLAAVDLEYRLKAGEEARAEDYLRRYPELGEGPAALTLIAQEYRQRRHQEPGLLLEDYQRRFPQYGPELPALLDTAANPDTGNSPGGKRPQAPAGPDTPALPPPAPAAPGARGDGPSAGRYRPVRFHARGGLGEVFLAEDAELRRSVALKRIQGRYACDPDSRRRFLVEAEITARLEHPGVVPVLGLVEDEAGQPCYAMRFIEGPTLAQAVNEFHAADGQPGRDPGERSMALRKLLGHFVAVCNTVAYAHSRGVLHRDLKPANVLLGKYGETLVVDWGLAKPFDRTETERAAGEGSLGLRAQVGPEGATQPGEVKGTPEFMSPEQAAGRADQVGPPTDIFGLGATLYMILTGRPPYQGNLYQVMAQAQRAEFPLPRRLKTSVPAALEAVCQKAMAAQPGDRYATAQELGAEVERWLADEPVAAYPEPWTTRLGRWTSRHRLLVTSGVAALVFAAASLAVISAVLAEAGNRELLAKQEALEGKNQARRNFRFARQTVEDYCTKVAANLRLREEDLQDLRKELLRLGLRFHEELKDQIGDDAEIQADRAEALLQLGILAVELGKVPDAIHYYADSAASWDRLARAAPAEPKYRRKRAICDRYRAELYRRVGKIPEAKALFQQALGTVQELIHAHPSEADFQSDFAQSLFSLGILYFYHSEPKRAEDTFQRAIAVWQKLVKDHRGAEAYQSGLARAYYELAYLYHRTKRLERSEETYGQALRIQERLAKKQPKEIKYQVALSNTYDGLGPLYRDRNKLNKVESVLLEALKIRREVVKAHPNMPEYKDNLAGSYTNLANWYTKNGLLNKAKEFREQGHRIKQELADAHPWDLDLKTYLGLSFLNMAQDLLAANEPASALKRLREAKAHFQTVLAKDPNRRTTRMYLGGAYSLQAEALSRLGRHGEAIHVYQRGLKYTDKQDRDSYRLAHAALVARAGDHARAAGEADQWVQSSRDVLLLRYAVGAYALAAASVARDVKLSRDQRRVVADRYCARAVKTLRLLHGLGYFQDAGRVETLKKDNELSPLRSRPDFQKLLAELERKRRHGARK
jgi:serine/threonine-protein kinase